MLLLVKNSLMKKEVWNDTLSWWKSQFFVAKVRGEVFAHLHAFAVKHSSCKRNWLFGLPGQTACEQFPLCKIKWWACSRLFSTPVSPYSVCPEPCLSFEYSCMAHSFFPERLSNHCQGLRRTVS
jgi:hypothetical protein